MDGVVLHYVIGWIGVKLGSCVKLGLSRG